MNENSEWRKVSEVIEIFKKCFVSSVAQELVSDWLATKLKQELASDGEAEDTVSSIPPVLEASGHLKHDNFDGKNWSHCSKL